MIKINQNKKNYSGVIIAGSIIVAGIFFFTLVFIYPTHRTLSNTRQTVLEKKAELERLNLLFPVFAKSRTLNRVNFEPKLPLPTRKQIRKNELAKLSKQISQIARHNNMTLSNSNFDINSLRKTSELVSITIELFGEFIDFRPFLIDIIALKFFNSITTLKISSDQNRVKYFSLKLDIKTNKQ
jgi:hypothetical protein